MSADSQDFRIPRGEDAAIAFSGGGDVTGWALAFYSSAAAGAALLAGFPLTVGDGITVTGAAAGEFTVVIPAARTARAKGTRDAWDLWRTDSGNARRLASGTLTYVEPVRRPS